MIQKAYANTPRLSSSSLLQILSSVTRSGVRSDSIVVSSRLRSSEGVDLDFTTYWIYSGFFDSSTICLLWFAEAEADPAEKFAL